MTKGERGKSEAADEAQIRSESIIGRREMLRSALTLTFVGATCLLENSVASASVKSMVKTGRGSRPKLTVNNINRLIRSVNETPKSSRNRAIASKALGDWRALVASEFQLTNVQRRNLDTLSPQVVAAVKVIIERAEAGHISLSVSAVSKPTGEVTPSGRNEGAKSRMQIDEGGGHVDCTFDADCGGWNCSGPKPGIGLPTPPPKPGDP